MINTLWLKLGGVVLAAALLAGIAISIYNKGKTAGRVEGAADQLQQDRAQFEQDRQQFLARLQHYQEADDAAKAQVEAQNAQIAQLRHQKLSLQSTVAAVPDAELVHDIQRRLGDAPGDALSDGQLRRIDQYLATAQNLEAQVAALEAKSEQQDKRIDAIEHQRDAAMDAYNKLVPLYAKAYNASQRKHSLFVKIITLGLMRDRKIDLPAPATLEHP